jgi:ATP-dependent exoDNAse (exonuclease V) beta subunit
MAEALAPSFGLDASAAAPGGHGRGARARPARDAARARGPPHVARAAAVVPGGAELLEGVIDLVFEEDGALVLVDYKTDGIAAEQALAQAAHHAPQLQLYGAAWPRPGPPRARAARAVHALGQVVAV